jgi:hypothetical protein
MPDIPPNITAVLRALKFCGSRRESLRTLTDFDWENLLTRWEIIRLMVPLRHICADDLPEWVRSRIDQNLADNAQRFERIKVVYSEFSNALRDTGAEHLVVKGFAQWPDFVEHPRSRLQSDVDVYCPPESICRARDALSNLGYEPTPGDFGLADHLPSMVLKTSWRWRGNHYDPEMPVSFDLHFRFWNESFARFGPKGLDQLWLRRVERRLDDFSFPALSPVDNAGYCALNMLRDALHGPVSIHLVYELARFLHTNVDNEEFWRSWRELHDDTFRGHEVISFRLASHFFACRLSEEVEKETSRLPAATKMWFQKYADSSLSALFRMNKDSLLLHLTLIESSRDKRAVLFKRLFPTRIQSSVETVSIQNAAIDGQESVGAFRKHVRYVDYLISRGGYHTRALLPTLWDVARLWLSTKNLSKGFWTFFAACFFFDFGMYIFFLLYNLYLLDRGFKENFLGLVASASAIGGIAGTIPAGLLAQRLGLRKALLLCLTLVSVTFALRSLLVREVPPSRSGLSVSPLQSRS